MAIVMNMSDYVIEKKTSPESMLISDLKSENKKRTLELAIQHYEERLPNRNTVLPQSMATIDIDMFLQKMLLGGQ